MLNLTSKGGGIDNKVSVRDCVYKTKGENVYEES